MTARSPVFFGVRLSLLLVITIAPPFVRTCLDRSVVVDVEARVASSAPGFVEAGGYDSDDSSVSAAFSLSH
ncbi:MAG: hypothetical protein R3F34_05930 [Planctomycetota bacterium]